MKESLHTAIRHALTALAGLGAFLASKGLLDSADAPAVDAAGLQVSDALTVILGAMIMRLLIFLMGKIKGLSGDKAGMALFWFAGTAVGCMTLPSCSPANMEAMRSVPIKACYIDKAGNSVCYSSKGGISVEVDQRSGK
jgi:hypothetical protein